MSAFNFLRNYQAAFQSGFTILYSKQKFMRISESPKIKFKILCLFISTHFSRERVHSLNICSQRISNNDVFILFILSFAIE